MLLLLFSGNKQKTGKGRLQMNNDEIYKNNILKYISVLYGNLQVVKIKCQLEIKDAVYIKCF